MVEVGDCVVFVDSVGKEHDALLTAVFRPNQSQFDYAKEHQPEIISLLEKQMETPSVNVVIISKDESKNDPYGRQIERHTSVVHQKNQYAHGMYWKEKNQ